MKLSKKFNNHDLINLSNVEHSIIAMLSIGCDAEAVIEEYISAKKRVNETIERMLRDE